ncbi:MAG TPA: cysteine synthase family protein, partial [Acidimicrobiales bacterium]|nr:cysteine synthase family protein [Acidimicrobiales bacterium]
MPVYDSIADLVGNTPIVDVSALSPNPRVRILAKLEGWNPGGSVKDRAARWMLDEAEKDGSLKPGQVILESSSGNTGIALAMLAKMRGYPFKVVLPENVSIERRQLLETWGAEIIWSPGAEGSNGAMRRAKTIAAEHPEWYFPYQYGNPANPKTHYEGTGPEIWRDCPEITHFVAGLGTGGTLTGAGRRLHEHDPDIRIIAAEPELGDLVYGLRSMDEGFIPPIFDESVLDRKFLVSSSDSLRATRALTEREGIFAGISPVRVTRTAARAPGSITPTTGTPAATATSSIAETSTELQATTSIL